MVEGLGCCREGEDGDVVTAATSSQRQIHSGGGDIRKGKTRVKPNSSNWGIIEPRMKGEVQSEVYTSDELEKQRSSSRVLEGYCCSNSSRLRSSTSPLESSRSPPKPRDVEKGGRLTRQ